MRPALPPAKISFWSRPWPSLRARARGLIRWHNVSTRGSTLQRWPPSPAYHLQLTILTQWRGSGGLCRSCGQEALAVSWSPMGCWAPHRPICLLPALQQRFRVILSTVLRSRRQRQAAELGRVTHCRTGCCMCAAAGLQRRSRSRMPTLAASGSPMNSRTPLSPPRLAARAPLARKASARVASL